MMPFFLPGQGSDGVYHRIDKELIPLLPLEIC